RMGPGDSRGRRRRPRFRRCRRGSNYEGNQRSRHKGGHMRALGLVGAVAVLASCAPSILPVTASTVTRIDVPPRTNPVDSTAIADAATVEVRYYPHSPTVTIVAWDDADAAYGLRAWLRRDGSLIVGHRLYVSTYYTPRRSEEHTSELQSRGHLVCRLLLEKKKDVSEGSISFARQAQQML